MRIRPATKKDKGHVLRFCDNTFDWGDYIGDVWDSWLTDQSGLLIVAEENDCNLDCRKSPSVIAVSHVSLCPTKENIWLEGIRVNPKYRRRSVATELIDEMISFGEEHGAKEASAMVSKNNIASQLMMEKSGFTAVSKWNYYSIDKNPHNAENVKSKSKVASSLDTDIIRNYLNRSETYKSSGQKYVSSWRWCSFDLVSDTLPRLVNSRKVLVVGNDPIEGLAIINSAREWNKTGNSIGQIVYLDSSNTRALKDICGFTINLMYTQGELCDRIQVYSPQITSESTIMGLLKTDKSEQFLLYEREI